MKKVIFKSFLLILTVALFASCRSTLNVSSNYDKFADFTMYKTFSLNNPTASGNVNPENVERIVKSVRAELTKKGFTENNTDPDLVVNVATVLKTKQTVSATHNYAGFSGDIRTQVYWSQYGSSAGTVTVETSKHKDGSLVIDIQDAITKRSVWQGVGSADIVKAPKNPEQEISDAVTKIMASFPAGTTK